MRRFATTLLLLVAALGLGVATAQTDRAPSDASPSDPASSDAPSDAPSDGPSGAGQVGNALPFVEPPVEVDPQRCRPRRSGTFLALGSTRLAVVGPDAEGACRIEVFQEVEGAFTHWLCELPADRPPFEWNPLGEAPGGPPFSELCRVVAEGNLLLPEQGDPLIFPLTPVDPNEPPL
jgi:hypothetical protein